VNGGFSNDPINCRFHKTEIHTTGANRDEKEAQNKCMTSPLPFYPFGGEHCREVTSCVKQYPLEASMYFLDHHPLFGLRECSHVFSGDAQYFRDPKIDVPIRELTDEVLYKWYHKHYDSNYDQPFGHDVSNPFEFPHIKYFDPKELL
jgi:hypothetical protein